MKFKFITFEGAEFSGKTTQSKMLKQYFVDSGVDSILTREPGGTLVGESIRDIFLHSNDLSVTTELLLAMAARSEHIDKVIIRNLDSKMIICDRFLDSTLVYQGMAGGLATETILLLHELLFKNLMPDISFFLDIHPKIAMDRLCVRGGEISRFDLRPIEYHIQIYEAFLRLARAMPDRLIVIDANQAVEKIHSDILGYLK